MVLIASSGFHPFPHNSWAGFIMIITRIAMDQCGVFPKLILLKCSMCQYDYQLINWRFCKSFSKSLKPACKNFKFNKLGQHAFDWTAVKRLTIHSFQFMQMWPNVLLHALSVFMKSKNLTFCSELLILLLAINMAKLEFLLGYSALVQ